MTDYIPSKEATKRLGLTNQTLVKYANEGRIEVIRSKGGKRYYNVDKYLATNRMDMEVEETICRRKICYCRVSSNNQRPELENQIAYMEKNYPDHEIIKDIGSGINFKRQGLNKIIDYAINNELEEVVVTYKDRLCRIGFELIEHIFDKYSGTKVVIINSNDENAEEEITNDLLEIITVYSARVHGKRQYKKKV